MKATNTADALATLSAAVVSTTDAHAKAGTAGTAETARAMKAARVALTSAQLAEVTAAHAAVCHRDAAKARDLGRSIEGLTRMLAMLCC